MIKLLDRILRFCRQIDGCFAPWPTCCKQRRVLNGVQRTKKVDALTLLSMVDGPWRRAETNPAKFGVWGKVSEESTTVSGDARIPSHHGAKQVCVQLFFHVS